MAVFKKFENQEVRKLEWDTTQSGAPSDSGSTPALSVGDIISYDVGSKAIVKLAAVAADSTATPPVAAKSLETVIKEAVAAGLEIYIVAQGDMITYNEPTDYKTYIIKDGVSSATHLVSNVKLVGAYLVKTQSNVAL